MKRRKLLNAIFAFLCIFVVCALPVMAAEDSSTSGNSNLSIKDYINVNNNVKETKDSALWTPYQKVTAIIVAVFVGLIVWSLLIKGIKFLTGNGQTVSDAVFGILGILGVVLLVIVSLNSVFSFFTWSF